MDSIVDGLKVLRCGVRRTADYSGRESLEDFRKYATPLVVSHAFLGVVGNAIVFQIVYTLFGGRAASIWAYGAGIVLFVAFYILIGAPGVRRLHDVGQSGFWILVPLPLLTLGLGAQLISAADSGVGRPPRVSLVDMVEAAGGIGASLVSLYLVWRLTRPGELGPNRYGAEPRRPCSG